MNTEIHNCYNEDHLNIQANYYCAECKTYMCKKCENFHSKLFKKHNIYNLDKTQNISDIFTGFCKEENHTDKLEYFCKSHNKLCCAACIAKVKAKDKGQHSECEICVLEEIKESKVNKLKENISNLEKLAKDIDKEINELKITFQTINQNREDLKLNTQKIFTKIRNTINDREDEILLKIDELFNNAYMKENEMNDIDKYPKKIKSLLDKGKSTLDDLKNENKLNSLINNCIEIEKNLIDINSTEKNLKKCKEEKNESIKFIPSEGSELKNFISTIEKFGKIIKEKNKEPSNDIQMEINNNNENHILDFQIKSTNEELNGFSFKLFNFSEKEYNLYYPNNLEYNDDEIVCSIHLDNKNNSFDALKNLSKPFSIRDINQKLIIDFNFKSDNKKLLYLYEILINNNNISLALRSNFNFKKLKKENFEDCINDSLTFNFSINGDLKNIENSLLLTKPKIKDEKLQKEIESTAKFLMAFNIRKFNMIISKDKLNDFLIFIDKKKELIKLFDFIVEAAGKLLHVARAFGIEAKKININKILATCLNPRCKSGLVLEINAKGINEFVNELNEQKEE